MNFSWPHVIKELKDQDAGMSTVSLELAWKPEGDYQGMPELLLWKGMRNNKN